MAWVASLFPIDCQRVQLRSSYFPFTLAEREGHPGIADLRNEMASSLLITVLSPIGTALALVGFVHHLG